MTYHPNLRHILTEEAFENPSLLADNLFLISHTDESHKEYPRIHAESLRDFLDAEPSTTTNILKAIVNKIHEKDGERHMLDLCSGTMITAHRLYMLHGKITTPEIVSIAKDDIDQILQFTKKEYREQVESCIISNICQWDNSTNSPALEVLLQHVLKDRGMSINSANTFGKIPPYHHTPLMSVVASGLCDAAIYIIDKYEAYPFISDISGRNILHMLYANGYFGIGSPNIPREDQYPILRCVLQHSHIEEHINARDQYGNTALHYACALDCDAKYVHPLIDAGARIDLRNKNGQLPSDILRMNKEEKLTLRYETSLYRNRQRFDHSIAVHNVPSGNLVSVQNLHHWRDIYKKSIRLSYMGPGFCLVPGIVLLMGCAACFMCLALSSLAPMGFICSAAVLGTASLMLLATASLRGCYSYCSDGIANEEHNNVDIIPNGLQIHCMEEISEQKPIIIIGHDIFN